MFLFQLNAGLKNQERNKGEIKILKYAIVIAFILINTVFSDVKHDIYDLAEKLALDYQKKSQSVLFKKILAIINLKNSTPELKEYEVGNTVRSVYPFIFKRGTK